MEHIKWKIWMEVSFPELGNQKIGGTTIVILLFCQ